MSARETRRLEAKDVVKLCEGSEVNPKQEMSAGDAKLFMGVGQERFEQALALFVATDDPLHNMHAVDLPGTAAEIIEGKLKALLKGRKLPEPEDVCYLFNFEHPQQPVPYTFAKGEGKKFKKTIATLLSALRTVVPDQLSGKNVAELKKQARAPLEQWFREMEEKAREFALAHGFEIIGNLGDRNWEPTLATIQAVKGESAPSGRSLEDELKSLTPEQRVALGRKHDEWMNTFEKWFREQNIAQEIRRRQIEAERNSAGAELHVAKEVIEGVFQKELNVDRIDDDGLLRFREQLLEYSIASYQKFLKQDQKAQQNQWQESDEPFLPFEVKLFVDHSEAKEDVPIVAASISRLSQAVGTISRRSSGPFSVTVDHRNLSPGIFHMANGGYLILDAKEVASVPGLWHVLKDMLRNREIPVGEPYSFGAEVLKPEPIVASLKVILFGPAWLMYLFSSSAPEFSELFKIRGEVLTKVERKPEQIRAFRAWLDAYTQEKGIHTLKDDGVCAVIEYAQRLAGDQEHLATDFDALAALIQQSNTLISDKARGQDSMIGRKQITQALKDRVWRSDVGQTRRLKSVGKQLIVATTGTQVGQINGIAVSGYNGEESIEKSQIENFCKNADVPFKVSVESSHAIYEQFSDMHAGSSTATYFGFPTRITAIASVGRFAVVNIHNEVKLAGTSFQKADLTVQGLLRGLYGVDETLDVHITYAFEQTYSGIDGDSASLAKFMVLTSAISGVPLRQDIAVTGSVSQKADVQPIGGANEKIEGWYDVCKQTGLTGEQGFLLPHSNVNNLMLRQDLVDAIEQKKFSIWSAKTLDDVIEIFTGLTAAEYHEKVKAGLKDFAKKAKKSAPKKTETSE